MSSGTGIIGGLHRKCKGSDMNRLPRARQVNVLNLLLEGCSIRSTARLTGVHKTTIASLLVDVGGHCQALLDHHLRNLTCPIIEADEIWTFVQKKQHRLTVAERADQAIGDQYAFVGFDPTSKLVVAHVIGKRDAETTTLFMEQLRSRVPGRIQFFTDGFPEYGRTIDGLYGTAIDYAQVIKPIPSTDPGEPGSLHIVTRVGHPNPRHIGTSYVERNNLTMRQHIRRFTRKSLGFSKTLRNLRAALALFFAYYNFCRVHGALRMTPAMALGITDTIWETSELLT